MVFIGARGVSYKNFEKAVKATALTKGIKLVIIGAPLSDEETALLDREIPQRYEILEYPEVEDICRTFNESLALLYLSDYEGFGLPLLEGMAAGLPVIAGNNSSIPEVSDGNAIMLDSVAPSNVANVIEKLESDEAFFNEVVEKGLQHSKKYSWEVTAKKTCDFYHEVWDQFCK